MKIESSTYSDFLRLKAEALLKDNKLADDKSFNYLEDGYYNASAPAELVHELQVYHIELEMQNDELKLALAQAEEATSLYNHSPNCFFTLSKDGLIIQLNYMGALTLGKSQDQLIGTDFRQYIIAGNEYIFNNFLRGIFKTLTKKTCELAVKSNDCHIFLHLEGKVFENEHQCLIIAYDITELKKRQELLENAQTNFISLINNREESIFSIDTKFNLIIYNNFFRDESFAAYNVELKEGMNVLDIFPPHLSVLWKQKFTRALSGRKVIFEYSNQVGNELHDYEVYLNPVISNKKVTGVTALSAVVTWRKQAEETLRHSEERHRLLADNASDVISMMDMDGRFTYISPSVKKLSGYTPDEAIIFSINEIYDQESTEIVLSNLNAISKAIKSGDTLGEYRNELQQWRKHGSKIWVDVTTSAMLNSVGEYVGILFVTRDINDRKMAEMALRQSENKYRSLYESIIDGFACIDMEGQIIDCNNSFLKMLGYHREELLKLHFSDIIPEKWHAAEQFIIREQIIPYGYSEVYEEEFIRNDGTIIPIEIRIFAVRDALNEIERMCAIVRNISEQKRVREELSKSEKLYHSLFEKSNAVNLLIDQDTGAIVDVNLAACKYYGYSREELKTFNLSEINMMQPLQLQAVLAKMVKGKALRHEVRHRLADSTIRDVEVYASPIEIEGRMLLHSIVHDITDRIIAEEALVASESRFRNLLQNISAVAVQGYAPDGKIVYWNHASELLYGYSAQEAIGRSIIKLLVPPANQESMIQGVNKMVDTGIPVPSSEMTLTRRNGSSVDVLANHAFVQIPGRAPELFCFDIDLTERNKAQTKLKESNEIFRQFLENSPIYIFFKDEKLRTLQLSRNYETLFGKPLNELLGRTIKEVDVSELSEIISEDENRILKEGIKIEGEDELLGRYFSTIKFPIKIPGQASKIAGFRIDITERKKAEQALRDSELRFKELNATKDKFFSIIAHDLKGPFNSIMGFSEILIQQMQERDYDEIDKYATIIQKSSEQVLSLLKNLLEWSRSQTGTIDFKPEKINICTLISEATQLFYDSAQQKSLDIYIHTPEEIHVAVDRPMVLTVLRNLISNAIKFTHPGGEIVVTARCSRQECEISVSDNGIGIKKEAMDKLFRIDSTYSTIGTNDETGTGLGLILCKDFIDKHHGKIWVESQRGSKIERGHTIFHFTIPLA